MTVSIPVFIYALIVFVSIFLLVIAQLLLRLTLDRRVRAAMPPDKEYNFCADWWFGYGRAIIFGYACCFGWANKSWVIRDCYDGFDIKAFANPFEKTIGYISIVTLAIVSSSAIIVPVLRFFGHI